MRIYFDENFSHRIAKGMREFQDGKRSENIYVIWCPDEFGRGAADEDWIPKVATKQGIILTQDINIHRTKAQWALCQSNKIGVFFFKPPRDGWNHWAIIKEVVNRWENIKRLSSTKRPFGWVIEYRKAKLRKL